MPLRARAYLGYMLLLVTGALPPAVSTSAWNPPLRCNPKAKPPETCPDGNPCPASGLCPTETWWQLNDTD
eukprot:COSAG06_NODE_20701_length_785_cov_0.712828_1_plen_69_part_10